MSKKKRPPKLFTLDTETYNGLIGGLKRIAIYDGERVHFGYKFSEVEGILTQAYDEGLQPFCYIHNIEFDLRKIPEVFQDNNVIWNNSVAIKNKIAKLDCKKYTFLDSLKILPMSLKKASKDFNVTHGKLDLWNAVQEKYPDQYSDLVDFLDRCNPDDPVYLEYLGYDVISLYEVIEKLIEVSGLPLDSFVKCMTTASLARRIYKEGYKGKLFKDPDQQKKDYDILCLYNYKNRIEQENFFRAAYCGGRTEVFKMNMDTPGYHYDVNSLYPFVCMGSFPIGKPRFSSSAQEAFDIFENWMQVHNGLGFLMAHVYVPMQNIPPLPAKMGKLCFPCGHLYGVWSFEELEYSIINCDVEIIEYIQTAHFPYTFPVFKNFISEFSELKIQADQEGNLALRTLCKLLMNTSYGYTGMRRDDKTKLIPIEKMSEYPSDEIVTCCEDLGYAEAITEVKSPYIQVAVAATVTSRARLILLEALRYADAAGSVFYCDTDSIVTDVQLPDSWVDPRKLGKWALESTPEKGIFLLPKVYSELYPVDQEVAAQRWNTGERSGLEKMDKFYSINKKFKGVTKETQNSMEYSDYQRLYQDFLEGVKETVQIEEERLTMRSILYMHKKGMDMNHVEFRDKKLNLTNIQKRDMNFSENTTTPHYFSTLEDFDNFEFTKREKFVRL